MQGWPYVNPRDRASVCWPQPTAPAAPTAAVLLKEMPAKGALSLGEVIYVDEGKCAAGEITKITGGNQKAGVARQVGCVKRPEGS